MSRISVRKDIFAVSPVTPHNRILTTAKNTRKESKPSYTHSFRSHFKKTKSNIYKSLPNFGLWYIPPEGPMNLSPTNVHQLELFSMALAKEAATPAKECVPHNGEFVEQGREYAAVVGERCYLENIHESTAQVVRNVGQTESGEKENQREAEMITIGPNGTNISWSEYKGIQWSSLRCIREILYLVFDQETLQTHTLCGKSRIKGRLDTRKMADIIHCVKQNTKYSECDIRRTIIHGLRFFSASEQHRRYS